MTELAKVNRISGLSLMLLTCFGLAACGTSSASTSNAKESPHAAQWQVVIKTDTSDVTGLALDGQGHIYLAEIFSDQIEEFSVDGTFIRRWGSSGSAPGELDEPAKVALDTQGDVYVTEVNNNRVQKFSATGEPLAMFGGKAGNVCGPLGSVSRNCGSNVPGSFNFPIGIALDSQGNMFVADLDNSRIQKLSPLGRPLAQWTYLEASGQSLKPYDVALDASGDLYVSDAGVDRVVEFSPTGAVIEQIGSTGSGPGELNTPRGVVIGNQGNLYLDDTGNNRIQKLSPSGAFLAQWLGPADTPFSDHTEIALDGNGILYASIGGNVYRLATT